MMKVSALVLVGMELTGCASIVNGGDQTVLVETWYEEEKITGAECDLKNEKGKYSVVTPDSITIQRAGDDLFVECKKEEFPKGFARTESGWGGAAYGNILAGGLIGVAVDANTGAAYSYPEVIPVHLGKKVLIEDEEVIVVDEFEDSGVE